MIDALTKTDNEWYQLAVKSLVRLDNQSLQKTYEYRKWLFIKNDYENTGQLSIQSKILVELL
jgi:hypothetical protein